MHQIQVITTKHYHRIWNIFCFIALHYGILLKYKITNVLVLVDLIVYCERLKSNRDL